MNRPGRVAGRLRGGAPAPERGIQPRGRRLFPLVGLPLAAALTLSACGAEAAPDPALELGRLVFTDSAQPTCATCHALRDAGATGMVGPNLDQLRPDSQRVVNAVTTGVGIMPSQKDVLRPDQIDAVAHYVATVAGAVADE